MFPPPTPWSPAPVAARCACKSASFSPSSSRLPPSSKPTRNDPNMVFPSQWCKIGLALPLPPAFNGLFPGSGRLKPLIFDLRGEPVPEEFRLSGGFSIRATQGGESTVVSTPHTVNDIGGSTTVPAITTCARNRPGSTLGSAHTPQRYTQPSHRHHITARRSPSPSIPATPPLPPLELEPNPMPAIPRPPPTPLPPPPPRPRSSSSMQMGPSSCNPQYSSSEAAAHRELASATRLLLRPSLLSGKRKISNKGEERPSHGHYDNCSMERNPR
jgi:hypothetical protein